MIRTMLAGYDYNLPLRDALRDPDLSADRHALAAVSMRQDLDDALFSAHELLEAFRILETDARLNVAFEGSAGSTAIEAILQADGDDYQRRLYWILSAVAIGDAVLDLEWLTALLDGRARMHRAISDTGARAKPMPGN